MSRRKKDPLRPLTDDESATLTQLSRSQAAPAAQVARAVMLLAVAGGDDYQQAARAAGRRSGDAVSHPVARFNAEGTAAPTPRHGGGHPVVYGTAGRQPILPRARAPLLALAGRGRRHLPAAPRRPGRPPRRPRPPPGPPLHRGGPPRAAPPPWRRPSGRLWHGGTPADPRRGRPASDPGGRRDGDLVPGHAAHGVAIHPRRPARGLDLHALAGAPRGRLQPPADPHLVPHRHRPSPPQGRRGGRHRPGRRVKKKLIEDAYRLGEVMGLSVWCADQAGPFQTVPRPGPSWQPECEPARQPHEYLRDGTAKVLTLFHPADGRVRLEGVTACPNAVLHPWFKRELTAILDAMAAPPAEPAAGWRAAWGRWQDG